ncbi:MAG: hypothetical protein ABW252_07400 [Polyangiales bacterium]
MATRFAHKRLSLWLVACAVVLSSSALPLDFYLDDWLGRFVYSDLEGAARLYRNYSGGYGLAIGDAAENRWQMEEGWAPWWHHEQLRIALYRPIGVVLHALDFRLWPDSPLAMRLQNLLWLGGAIIAATWMYRIALGAMLGGAAALLLAFDHTHGYAVGHICNRHAIVGALLGALSLGAYLQHRKQPTPLRAVLGPLLYALGLLSSESLVAITAYVVAHAVCVQRGCWVRRALSVAPYLVITVVWRWLYNAAGYGAANSGVYIDVGREPLHFARNFLERGPLLWLGQFLTPPSEVYVELGEHGARVMLGFAVLVVVLSVWAFAPLLRRDAIARFWFLGMLGALVPAAATHPHNRQLVFASFGAMALLAQLWRYYARTWSTPLPPPARVAKFVGLCLIAFHAVSSPLGLPLTTASVAVTKPVHAAAAGIDHRIAGRDVVFVTTPEYYAVRLMKFMRSVNGDPLPRRVRAISGEAFPITVTRVDARTLEVTYARGLLGEVMGDDLHRDRRFGMPVGTQVNLSGFAVEVLRTTEDGRPDHVRFRFDVPLEDESLVFFRWDETRFVPFVPPAVGAKVVLPGATAPLGA